MFLRALLAFLVAASVQPALAVGIAPTSANVGLVLDPAVRTGQLPNGMRYVLRQNATPPGEVSIRLRIATGSLNETDRQRGVAHLLEHLVLNGTRNVPEGEFTRRSERLGLRLGADSNATTDWQQTVYRFDLPRSDPDSVGTALFLLREIADRATLDPGALERERGVILAEERARATPGQRVGQDVLAWHFRGQLLADRQPIGTVESIRTVPRAEVLAFYQAWYRPENATLIVVGDIDPQQLQARIRKEFGDWKGDGPAGPRPDQGRPLARGLDQAVTVDPSVPQSLSVSWLRPSDARPDSAARRIEDLHERIVLDILNRRLLTLAQQEAGSPFTAAVVRSSRLAQSGLMTQLNVQARGGDWRAALRAAALEQRRLVQFGPTQSELGRTLLGLRTSLQTFSRSSGTLPSRALADLLLAQVNEDAVPTSAEAQLALFEEAVRNLQPATLTAAAARLFTGSGPLLYLVTPRPLAAGAPGPADVWTASQAQAVTPQAEETVVAWPYAGPGQPANVAERRSYPALGVTAVRLSNGVRLLVRPSTARKEQVMVRVNVGHGRAALPANRPSTEWAFGSALIGGGTSRLSLEEVQRALAGKITGLSLVADDDSFVLSGGTRTEDLATQLQLMTAYLGEPGWRRSGFERMRANAGQAHQAAASTPAGVLGRDLDSILRSGDPRYRLPPLPAMLATRAEDVRAVLAPALAEGPLEVTIVGDIDVEEVIRQAAATFGTLPARAGARRTGPPPAFPRPAPQPVRLLHAGRADQAAAAIAWPTTGVFGDMQRSRVLSVLAAVVQQRMMEKLREEMGSTYVPFARHMSSRVWESYGYLLAGSEAPPEKLAEVHAAFRQIAGELAIRPIDDDELQRAVRPMLLNFDRERATNEYWLGALKDLSVDPRVEQLVASRSEAYRRITAADLQAAARDFFRPERALAVEVVKAPAITVMPPPVVTAPSS